jgi:hypothetical protein
VARIHTNNAAKIRVISTRVILFKGAIDDTFPRNRADVISLMARMLVYSAMKIRANRPLLYSTLNPDTSSDSPSAKSNGVRFVSAKLVINQITPIGMINISGHTV